MEKTIFQVETKDTTYYIDKKKSDWFRVFADERLIKSCNTEVEAYQFLINRLAKRLN